MDFSLGSEAPDKFSDRCKPDACKYQHSSILDISLFLEAVDYRLKEKNIIVKTEKK